MNDEELLRRDLGSHAAMVRELRELLEWLQSDEGRAAMAEDMADQDDEFRKILGALMSDDGAHILERVAREDVSLNRQLDRPAEHN